MTQELVSIVIPTKNSESFLDRCLSSIRKQTYKRIEIVLVDGYSTDSTIKIANKYDARIFLYEPKVAKGFFDAPYRRNYGVAKSKGKYIYIVDADMELGKNVVASCVNLSNNGADAVIIPEDSFGVGIWASAKNLERRCYWGDDSVEAPRFIIKSVWNAVGGLDTSLGGGGDDWDLTEALREAGYTIKRTKEIVLHNEGELTLTKLFRKRYMYGRDSIYYLSKRPKAAAKSYFPIRMAYIRNWRLFLMRPVDTLAFIIMRTTEYAAGLLGVLVTLWKKK